VFFLRQPSTTSRAIHGKIEVFARHCMVSKISQHKKRLAGYSREKCFHNLLSTLDRDQANLTVIFDVNGGKLSEHFLAGYPEEKIVTIQAGTEALAFLLLLDYIASLSLHPDTIIYIVEDDYLHRPFWADLLREAFLLPGVDYVTLYDHRDKYFLPIYSKLTSRLLISSRSHWRTTPSTTNTFAVRFGTLIKDLSIHQRYSCNCSITADHKKFCRLIKNGRMLISPIPGWSTHCEMEYASPCVQWDSFLI
jgi:hypothetical protein